MTTHVEQMHVQKMIHVTDLRDGDMIDTTGWWAPGEGETIAADDETIDRSWEMLAECEYAVVGSEDEPFTVETDDCVVIHFENFPSYGYPIDKPITVQRRMNPIPETP